MVLQFVLCSETCVLMLRHVNLSGTRQLRVLIMEIRFQDLAHSRDMTADCAGIKSKRYKCTADMAGGEVVPKEHELLPPTLLPSEW